MACAAAVATIQVGAWAVVNLGHLFGVLGLLVESKGNGWEWGFAALFFSMQLAHARQSRQQGPGMSLPRVWRHSASMWLWRRQISCLAAAVRVPLFSACAATVCFFLSWKPKEPPPQGDHTQLSQVTATVAVGRQSLTHDPPKASPKASPTSHPKTLVSIVAC